MIIAPCSMKTLAGIRTGYAEGLVGRAAFYNHPQCVGDIIDHVAMRVLDQFGIEAPVDTPRWSGLVTDHGARRGTMTP